MTFWDHVQRCSFGGLDFPVDDIETMGALRDHVHEFPHADGGAPEKLGRKLYVIKVHAIFDEGIFSYPENYPDTLWKLRTLFESGITDDLTLPNLGTIKAYCRTWPQKWTSAVRSGETATFEFVEDPQITSIGVFNLNEVPSSQAMTIELDHFDQEAAAQQDRWDAEAAATPPGVPVDLSQASQVDPATLSGMSSAFASLLALRDTENLAGAQLEQRVASVTQYAAQIDAAISSPFDYHLLYAVQTMVTTAQAFSANAKNTFAPIKFYVVPATTTIMAISVAIFGDTAHAMDLLQANDIADAFRIPAGTRVKYIDSSASVGSMSLGTPAPFFRAAG